MHHTLKTLRPLKLRDDSKIASGFLGFISSFAILMIDLPALDIEYGRPLSRNEDCYLKIGFVYQIS